MYKRKWKLDEFDTNKIGEKKRAHEDETDQHRSKIKKEIDEGRKVLIDKALQFSIHIPSQLKKDIGEKFNIKVKELEPFFHQSVYDLIIEETLKEFENNPNTLSHLNMIQYQ